MPKFKLGQKLKSKQTGATVYVDKVVDNGYEIAFERNKFTPPPITIFYKSWEIDNYFEDAELDTTLLDWMDEK